MPQHRCFTRSQSQQQFAMSSAILSQPGDRLGTNRLRGASIPSELGQNLKSPATRALAQDFELPRCGPPRCAVVAGD